MRMRRSTLWLALFVFTSMALSASPPAHGSRKPPEELGQMVTEAQVLVRELWALFKEDDWDAPQLTARWSSVATTYSNWLALARRATEANEAYLKRDGKEFWVPLDKDGTLVQASYWIDAQREYLREMTGQVGARMAAWRGAACHYTACLEKMRRSAPLYIAAFKAMLTMVDARLDEAMEALGKAQTLVEIERVERALRTTRAMATNAQTALRRQRAVIEKFMLDVAPDPLDTEAGTIIESFLSERFSRYIDVELRQYNDAFVQLIETSMKEYEDLHESTDDALLPFLDGSAFDSIGAFTGRSLGTYLEPVKLVEEAVAERRKVAEASSDLVREIEAAMKEARILVEQVRVQTNPPILDALARSLERLEEKAKKAREREQDRDRLPDWLGLLPGFREQRDELATEKLGELAMDIGRAAMGSARDGYEALLVEARAAQTPAEVQAVLRRFTSFRSSSRKEVSTLKKAFDRMRYEAGVLKERIENLAR